VFYASSDRSIAGMDQRKASMRSDAASHMHAALNGMSAGLLTFNRNLEIVFVNDRLADMLEIPPAMVGRSLSLVELFASSAVLDEAIVQRLQEACVAAADAFAEHRSTLVVSSGPASRFFSLGVTRLADGHWMVSFEEVTARRSAEANALELAMHDPLTGLPNRQLFHNRVVLALTDMQVGTDGESTEDQATLAVMLVDLDRFKAVNDTLGHPVGDGLLRLVSKRLRAVLRPRDDVARLGGDEFALLISPAPDEGSLIQLATRIVDVLGRPYLIDGHLVNIGASVGVALAPRDGREHSQLLRSADLALYQAKKAGRGTFSVFEPELDVRALAKRSLEIDLRKALALREFELYYQPQIDLDTDQVVGFEALLRWRHPERGMVPPADFIPLAEEIGLIVPIGEWVMREACCAATHWPSGVSVAVNVSPHQFTDTARLANTVARSLAASGLPGSRLEIEITESALLGNEEAVLAVLHRLRSMDVRIAMDDFGTGYSSLSQLHSFPFNKIKIDRSFVADREDVAGQNAIIRAITALGTSLGMSTIAEGVETADQLARIRAEGCTSAQGYLMSRPVPEGQINALIAELASRRLTLLKNVP
jgi:diguanylate cyclase (GGDEF)-like protein